jgi:hypothetical protein
MNVGNEFSDLSLQFPWFAEELRRDRYDEVAEILR